MASFEREFVSLHLGGGAYTLPLFVVDVILEDPVIVAEIDPGVTEANHVAARLERPPPFELHRADARAVVRDLARSGRPSTRSSHMPSPTTRSPSI